MYTPGPWETRGTTVIDGAPASVVTDSNGVVHAYVRSGNYPGDREGNTALVIAAPDLLEALLTALPFVEDAEHDPVFKTGVVAKHIKSIRAAIQKASA